MASPAPPKTEPQLPQGEVTIIGTISDNFAFHSSPESFITSRILRLHQQNPDLSKHRGILRAKVLNRNVAVVSSNAMVRAILGDDRPCDRGQLFVEKEEVPGSTFTARRAYDDLMAPFFSPPNLLLADPPDHGPLKERWKKRMAECLPNGLEEDCSKSEAKTATLSLIKKITAEHFRDQPSGSTVDLYESMKSLSWQLLLGTFLSLEKDTASYKEFESSQEQLLRGQFSLFPVSINTRFWQSPRSRGLDARKKVEALLAARLKDDNHGCPFATANDAERDDVASHLLMFTSSLAAKALASLLTASLLNLYIHRDESDPVNAIEYWHIMQTKFTGSDKIADLILNSLLRETGRMSPPVVGVMRRAEKDTVLKSTDGGPDTLIPRNWDVWLYFVAAGRDPDVYADPERFYPNRYMRGTLGSELEVPGFEFGWGPKSCLGSGFVQRMVRAVVDACIEMNLKLEADDLEKGVRGWLGWEEVSPDDWAKSMKQLPTQRPSRPVNVGISYPA